MTSPDVPHVHVRLSSWEWGCCGVTPAVGESVTVALTSGLAGDDEPFATEPVVDWRPDLELVGLPSCSAHYAPVDGDPRGRRLRLYGEWHDESRVIPRVEATIVTCTWYRRSSGAGRTHPGGSESPVARRTGR